MCDLLYSRRAIEASCMINSLIETDVDVPKPDFLFSATATACWCARVTLRNKTALS